MTITVSETGVETRLPNRWRGELVPLDVPTGDQRIIASPPPGVELKTRPMPIPLLYQAFTGDAHDGSYTIGHITRAWIHQNEDGTKALWGEGTFDLDDPRSEAMVRRVAGGWQPWVSVRLDNTVEVFECRMEDGVVVECPTATDVRPPGSPEAEIPAFQGYSIATDWRLMNTAVVAEPAFDTSRITETWFEEDHFPTNRSGGREAEDGWDWLDDFSLGRTGMLFAVSEKPWSDVSESDFTPQQWRRATLIHLKPTQGQDPDAKSLHKLPVRMPDGAVNRNAVHAAASVLAGGRGGVDAPAADKARAARALVRLYRGELDEEPPKSLLAEANMSASAAPPHVADLVSLLTPEGQPWRPDAEWFTNPELDRYTRVTITDGGRVFGHVAHWDATHIAFQGQQVRVPRSRTGYAWFKRRAVELSSNEVIRVGMLTFGPGHKDVRGDSRAAIQHYDATCAQGAVVTAGEDAHGIWIAGAVLPGLTPPDRNALALADLSGDWRLDGGHLEMVAAHCVNLPGFLDRTDTATPVPMAASGAAVNPSLGPTGAAERAAARAAARVRFGDDGLPVAMVAVGARPRCGNTPKTVVPDFAGRVIELSVRMNRAVFAERLTNARVRMAFARKNWVDQQGGLPAYIKRIANHLKQQGMDESRAIATAVNAAKKMCSNGDVNFPGRQQVNPGSRAEACNAVRQWEQKKARAKAS